MTKVESKGSAARMNRRNAKLTPDDHLEIRVMAMNMVDFWLHRFTDESAADRFTALAGYRAGNIVEYTKLKRQAREKIVAHLVVLTDRRASAATIDKKLGAEIARLKRESEAKTPDMRDHFP